MAARVPIPASHLAPITAFQGLADGSGTCAGPGRSLQAAQPPAPLPGSSPGRSWKRESGKKERKRKREGESGRQRRSKSSAGEQWGEERRRWSKAAPSGSLAANLLAPAGWARGARAMCGARSRPPPSASGWPETARAPQVSEWRGGRVSRECSPSAPGCRRVRSGDSLAIGARRVDLPAAKTFIMGWTPEGLGGDLRCRPFSEVHAQMGNLPDLYTGACVVRQRNSYI